MEHWNVLSNITVQDFNITAPLIKSQIVMTRILVLTYYIYKVGDFKQVDYELHRTRSQIMHETGELPSGFFIAVPQLREQCSQSKWWSMSVWGENHNLKKKKQQGWI